MMQTTLIIHPKDVTTDFLSDVYKDMAQDSFTLVNSVISTKMKKDLIKSHDRVIFMGHGDGYGLYGFNYYFIDSKLVYLLKDKPDNIYIWCNADEFVQRYELSGFATGMIISEYEEALYMCVKPDTKLINESNTQFAAAIRDSLHLDPHVMSQSVKEIYDSSNNHIIQYNNNNIRYFSYDNKS